MKFSLIICTYKRPLAINKLLKSVKEQLLYPNEILVIDGSPDNRTCKILEKNKYDNLMYFQMQKEDRGLTRQRNFGIAKVGSDVDVICFLDDDIVLTPEYFKELLSTYSVFPDAVGIGGYILNEVKWKKKTGIDSYDEYSFDGWVRKLGSRNKLRKRMGLLSTEPPGVMPEYSNGLSISFLPPSGKTYPVEFVMGGVSSYRRDLLKKINFSTFFDGYGLYEDMDFCLRASAFGQLYVNTGAKLYHYHEIEGRPNSYAYGKMVLRNGWYVWRVKYPNPSIKARVKWHTIALLLTLVRLGNVLSVPNKKEALTEGLGRISGWWSLFIKTPRNV